MVVASVASAIPPALAMATYVVLALVVAISLNWSGMFADTAFER